MRTVRQDGSKAENLPRFAPITQGADDKSQHAANVRKTGLGSSAALVTSMVLRVSVCLRVCVRARDTHDAGIHGRKRTNAPSPSLPPSPPPPFLLA